MTGRCPVFISNISSFFRQSCWKLQFHCILVDCLILLDASGHPLITAQSVTEHVSSAMYCWSSHVQVSYTHHGRRQQICAKGVCVPARFYELFHKLVIIVSILQFILSMFRFRCIHQNNLGYNYNRFKKKNFVIEYYSNSD